MGQLFKYLVIAAPHMAGEPDLEDAQKCLGEPPHFHLLKDHKPSLQGLKPDLGRKFLKRSLRPRHLKIKSFCKERLTVDDDSSTGRPLARSSPGGNSDYI